MMTLDAAFAINKGTAILVPGGGDSNNGQCEQWADYVYHNVYGFPYIYTPYASDYFYKADQLGISQHFDVIPRPQITSIPKGAFVVFGPLSAADTPGHIDVCSRDGGTLSDFWAYDSNWDAAHFHDSEGYPALHEVHHNDSFNAKIIGILVPKGGEMSPVSQQIPDALTVQLAYNIGLDRQPSDSEVASWKDKTVEQLMRTILESPEHKALQSKESDGGTVLEPGKYLVK